MSDVHPTEAHPRLLPQDVDAMRPAWIATLERIPGAGLKGDGFPRHVLGVLMRNPSTFGPFLDYWVTAKLETGLTVREQELIILRMACLFHSDYVFCHHVPLALEFGVDDAAIDGLVGGDLSAFTAREVALLTLTDELVEHRTIRRQAWDAFATDLPDADIVDLIGLVAQYTLFALANNALQVQLEAPLTGIDGIDTRRARATSR